MTDALCELSPAGLAWLREYLRDTYNDDFMSAYQLELVGVAPAEVRRWADIEPLPARLILVGPL